MGNENEQVYLSGCTLPHCCGQKPHNPVIYTQSPPLVYAQSTLRTWLKEKKAVLNGGAPT